MNVRFRKEFEEGPADYHSTLVAVETKRVIAVIVFEVTSRKFADAFIEVS